MILERIDHIETEYKKFAGAFGVVTDAFLGLTEFSPVPDEVDFIVKQAKAMGNLVVTEATIKEFCGMFREQWKKYQAKGVDEDDLKTGKRSGKRMKNKKHRKNKKVRLGKAKKDDTDDQEATNIQDEPDKDESKKDSKDDMEVTPIQDSADKNDSEKMHDEVEEMKTEYSSKTENVNSFTVFVKKSTDLIAGFNELNIYAVSLGRKIRLEEYFKKECPFGNKILRELRVKIYMIGSGIREIMTNLESMLGQVQEMIRLKLERLGLAIELTKGEVEKHSV